jgi:hypothetical protein
VVENMALSAIFGGVREEVAEGYRKLKSDKSDVGKGGICNLKAKG